MPPEHPTRSTLTSHGSAESAYIEQAAGHTDFGAGRRRLGISDCTHVLTSAAEEPDPHLIAPDPRKSRAEHGLARFG